MKVSFTCLVGITYLSCGFYLFFQYCSLPIAGLRAIKYFWGYFIMACRFAIFKLLLYIFLLCSCLCCMFNTYHHLLYLNNWLTFRSFPLSIFFFSATATFSVLDLVLPQIFLMVSSIISFNGLHNCFSSIYVHFFVKFLFK